MSVATSTNTSIPANSNLLRRCALAEVKALMNEGLLSEAEFAQLKTK
jgi:hypothetical protein